MVEFLAPKWGETNSPTSGGLRTCHRMASVSKTLREELYLESGPSPVQDLPRDWWCPGENY